MKNRNHSNVMLSIVTPAYNEAPGLPSLYQRLKKSLDALKIRWEWIVVDDHSSDGTYEVMTGIARKDRRVNVARFSRNFGSHLAILCGLRFAKGRAAAFLAADLQDPPELLKDFLDKWRKGAHVVWAVRAKRKNEGFFSHFLALFYYFLMRHLVGLKEMPSTGADFFLLDRKVLDALDGFGEKNISLISLISWMGFKQDFITYERHLRTHGKSRWTLRKKLKLVADSITASSYVPIRLILWTGILTFATGLVFLGFALWSQSGFFYYTLFFVFFGLQMAMMGVLGEYLWRALDESRSRPTYIIQETTLYDGNK